MISNFKSASINTYIFYFNFILRIAVKNKSFFHWLLPNRAVKIRNKQYSYAYRAEADLLRKDWESALERHSDRHPITYNGCMWMTTTHARKVQKGYLDLVTLFELK